MQQITESTDVISLVVPKDLDRMHAEALLMARAVQFCHEQYDRFPEDERPTIAVQSIEILLTQDPAEADAFKPAHDCEGCRENTKRVGQHLRENPDDTVGIANIYYTETL